MLFFPSSIIILVTNTFAYKVHWLRFQDLSLISPAILKARYQTKKHKHLILLKKLKVFKTAITLQDIAFGSGLSSSSTEFRKFAPEIVVNRSNQYVGVYSANLL